jgi:hypothetical protein
VDVVVEPVGGLLHVRIAHPLGERVVDEQRSV